MEVVDSLKQLMQSRRVLLLVASLLVAFALPFVFSGSFFVYVLTLIVIFTLYASSWNILAYSGQGSLGHAVFLGLGGFTSALAAINLGVPPIISLFAGGGLSAGIGLLIGLTCVRLKAWFLAMVTFGFSVIAISLFSQFDSVLHGNTGFPPRILIGSGLPFYYLAVSFTAVSIIVMYLILKSKMGLAFKAIKENEAESKMVGINTAKYKLIAFVISTFFAGIAGGLYVYFLGYVDNSLFQATNSFTPLIMSVIGGLGSLEGPIIGAVILVSVQTLLTLPVVTNSLQSALGTYFPSVSNVGPPLTLLGIGVFLVVIVIFAPKGVSSIFHRAFKRLRPKRKE
ncbi:MAG TPA: branched-chain amino acid ABC transporter permease [Candidatus Nanoarchaeia archaeon]|nr:branched-chain amino acid ABC transporter permease [Candidatus Nanoarchaeia archaeon]